MFNLFTNLAISLRSEGKTRQHPPKIRAPNSYQTGIELKI